LIEIATAYAPLRFATADGKPLAAAYASLRSAGGVSLVKLKMLKIRDYKLKPLLKFERPYFSPNVNNYEMDCVLSGNTNPFRVYLFLININTRFLFVHPLPDDTQRSQEHCVDALAEFNDDLAPGYKIQNIRADGDKAFAYMAVAPVPPTVTLGRRVFKENPLTLYLRDNNIKLFNFPSSYTNKCRIVDRAVRTIRDMVVTPKRFANQYVVRNAVEQYNNTPHVAFGYRYTPAEVQASHELERVFIRENQYRLDEINKLQHDAGLFKYKMGNILLIHLDPSKDKESLQKKRRAFNKLAEFKAYEYGNVRCKVLYMWRWEDNDIDDDVEDDEIFAVRRDIVIPIYYTKYLAPNYKAIPQEYRKNLL
jgi:hypothetical protein